MRADVSSVRFPSTLETPIAVSFLIRSALIGDGIAVKQIVRPS